MIYPELDLLSRDDDWVLITPVMQMHRLFIVEHRYSGDGESADLRVVVHKFGDDQIWHSQTVWEMSLEQTWGIDMDVPYALADEVYYRAIKDPATAFGQEKVTWVPAEWVLEDA